MAFSLLALLMGSAPLKTGDTAPDFTLASTDGGQLTLSKAVAEGPVVLFFFPKAFTSG